MRIYLFTFLILISCGTDQEINTSQKQNSMEQKNCIDVLKNDSISINSDIDVSNCDLQSLIGAFGLTVSDSNKGYLGTNQIPLAWWQIKTENGVEITFWAKADELVKIDVSRSYEPTNDVPEFVKKNGEPTLRLDYYYDVIKMDNLAAVYPELGIVLLYEIGEASVYKWSYFAPTSAKEYHENLHPVNAQREFEDH